MTKHPNDSQVSFDVELDVEFVVARLEAYLCIVPEYFDTSILFQKVCFSA
jgi:hypothetical protein